MYMRILRHNIAQHYCNTMSTLQVTGSPKTVQRIIHISATNGAKSVLLTLGDVISASVSLDWSIAASPDSVQG